MSLRKNNRKSNLPNRRSSDFPSIHSNGDIQPYSSILNALDMHDYEGQVDERMDYEANDEEIEEGKNEESYPFTSGSSHHPPQSQSQLYSTLSTQSSSSWTKMGSRQLNSTFSSSHHDCKLPTIGNQSVFLIGLCLSNIPFHPSCTIDSVSYSVALRDKVGLVLQIYLPNKNKEVFILSMKQSILNGLRRDVKNGFILVKLKNIDGSLDDSEEVFYPMLQFYVPRNQMEEGNVYLSVETMTWLITSTPIQYIGKLNPSLDWITYGNNQLVGQEIMKFDSDVMLQNTSSRTESHINNSMNESDLSMVSEILSQYGIITNLRKYQLEGVLWMAKNLQRSSISVNQDFNGWLPLVQPIVSSDYLDDDDNNNSSSSSSSSSSNDFNHERSVAEYYYHMETGFVCFQNKKQLVSSSNFPITIANSAILADSMGLGKSLQVLSLILYLKATHSMTTIANTTTIATASSSSTIEESVILFNPSISIASYHSWLKKSKKLTLEECKMECICGKNKTKQNKNDKTEWIQCCHCHQFYHISCVGSETIPMAPSSSSSSYGCISCECRYFADHPLPSQTTLIVMPDNLIHQWHLEISKHLRTFSSTKSNSSSSSNSSSTLNKPLQVFIYQGCDLASLFSRHSSGGLNSISPQNLSTYDIIIVGLSTLRKEIHLSHYSQGNSLLSSRVKSKSSAASRSYYPPPLLCIHFSLVVVDETQRLESTHVNHYLDLVSRIHCNYRLSVSGTPVGHGKLSDLKSLCYFLRIHPFDERRNSIGQSYPKAWQDLFVKSIFPISSSKRFQILCDIFGSITIRRTKSMVFSQLGLHEKKFVVKYLQLSKFEDLTDVDVDILFFILQRALYNERQTLVSRDLSRSTIISSSSSLSNTKETDIIKAVNNLEILRKGCCHPQVFDKSLANNTHNHSSRNSSKYFSSRSGRILGNSNGSSTHGVSGPRPFGEIMILKVEQSRLLCEEKLRELLYHLFSMAGIDLLRHRVQSNENSMIFNHQNNTYHNSSMKYLIEALLTYMISEKYHMKSRISSPLVTLIRIQSFSYHPETAHQLLNNNMDDNHDDSHHSDNNDEDEDLGFTAYIGPDHTTSFDLSLSWTMPMTHLFKSIEVASYSASSLPSISSSTIIENMIWNSNIHFALHSNNQSNNDNPSNQKISIYPHIICAGLHFHNSHRITSILSITMNVTTIENCILNSLKENEVGVILFPSSVALLSSAGSINSYAQSMIYHIQPPNYTTLQTINNHINIDNSIKLILRQQDDSGLTSDNDENNNTADYRSKSWKVEYRSIYEYHYIVVSKSNGMLCYTNSIPNISVSQLQSYFNDQHTITSKRSTVVIKGYLSTELLFGESVYDMDIFQQVHLGTNLLDATQLVLSSPLFSSSSSSSSISFNQQSKVNLNFIQNLVTQVSTMMNTQSFHLRSIHAVTMNLISNYNIGSSQSQPLDDDDNSNSNVISDSSHIEPVIMNITESNGFEIDDISYFKDIKNRITRIETQLLAAASSRHILSAAKLSDAKEATVTSALKVLTYSSNKQRDWWEKYFVWLQDFHPTTGNDDNLILSIYYVIDQGIEAYKKFRSFRQLSGLAYYITSELTKIEEKRQDALKAVENFGIEPTLDEIIEGGDCKRCRSYLGKIGPICRHCRIQDVIDDYAKCLSTFRTENKERKTVNSINALVPLVAFNHLRGQAQANIPDYLDEETIDYSKRREFEVDGFYLMIIKQLHMFINRYKHNQFVDIATAEVKYCLSLKSEVMSMRQAWNRRLELLKVYDEIQQCKQRIELLSSSNNTNNDSNNSSSSSSTSSSSSNVGNRDNNHNSTLSNHAIEPNDAMNDGLHAYELEMAYTSAYNSAVIAEKAFKDATSNLIFYKNQEEESRLLLHMRERQTHNKEMHVNPLNSVVSKNSDNGAIPMNSTSSTSVPASNLTDDGIENDYNCIICREDMRDSTSGSVVLLPCCHVLHKECIKQWLKSGRHTCPICKRQTQSSDLVPIASYGMALQNTIENNSTKNTIVKNTSILSPNDRTLQTNKSNTTSSVDNFYSNKRFIVGQWGTKIDTVVADIMDLIDNPDTRNDKAIVFSQWVEMIEILAQALKANGIQYSCCLTAKDFKLYGALDKFKADPDVPILLLPIHLGAEGLDLIVASHIFLFEPLMNVALEEQAINRIDRIGQTKHTYIYRYVVKDTVEERIHAARCNWNSNNNSSSSSNRSQSSNSRNDGNNISDKNVLEEFISPMELLEPIQTNSNHESQISYHKEQHTRTDTNSSSVSISILPSSLSQPDENIQSNDHHASGLATPSSSQGHSCSNGNKRLYQSLSPSSNTNKEMNMCSQNSTQSSTGFEFTPKKAKNSNSSSSIISGNKNKQDQMDLSLEDIAHYIG